MDAAVLFGFLQVIGISLVPVVLISALIHARVLLDQGVAVGRRLHLLRTPAPTPTGPPLQKLAADLRRLRPEVRFPRPGVTMARQRGIVAAYDQTLVRTAVALGLATTLSELPDGIDHEAERLRLEAALERAGISLQAQEH
jgi:hypothetical protein